MATPNTHFGAAAIAQMIDGAKHIHFIGVGGVMMSSLALITRQRGYRVSGTDRTCTAVTESLEAAGIEVKYEHSQEAALGADMLVYTVAISPDNPEYAYAKAEGIPCISRADYLGYIMMGYTRRVGIAGMHGKSTCTSMCAQVFVDAGVDPTVLSGATTACLGGAYRIGGRENFIFEACEYMDSFLDFNPSIAVILNVEMEHVDYFGSMEQIRESFGKYAALTGESGFAVVNGDDPEVMASVEHYAGGVVMFGIENEYATFRAVNLSYESGYPAFDILLEGEHFSHVQLTVPGKHNVYNALAAAASAHLCGICAEDIAKGLYAFGGAGRRMEYKGRLNGAPVYDDYGHHPTEVAATLQGMAQMGFERVFCVFQPHTYSRTAQLCDQFVKAFADADRVILVDIYAAREKESRGISSAKLASKIGSHARYIPENEKIAKVLAEEVTERDAVVIMGAGDVYRLFDCLPLEK
ncbi:MAG: UDP-N-acetylmuramate--L-alanine ligase [Clostridia bacterium]|nr:UDP-N-acetylmuramate--L-alanine ligase [Clostridia bacterium]